jgi:hypothetical protein
MAYRTDRRMRRYRTRVYRRRRLFAIVAVLVLVVALATVAFAVTRGGGTGGGGDSSAPAGDKPDGTAAAAPSPSGSATPSPNASAAWTGPPSNKLRLDLRKVISSTDISPKSVASTGTGYVFAQNMMYRHTMTVYDSKTLKLVKTIDDSIDAAAFGVPDDSGLTRIWAAIVTDGPVEASALSARCREILRERAPEFILRVPELPRNEGGKIARRRLAEMAVVARSRLAARA